MTRFPQTIALVSVLGLSACDEGLDFDLRDGLGGFDTSRAAQGATSPRPEPDSRGVISYPGYQVVVASRGDTVAAVATRLGLSARELARFNGLEPDVLLRPGEIIALPSRVEVIGADGAVDIESLAGSAIDAAPADAVRAPAAVGTTALPTGPEPVRHKVERGETAFTIARLYGVPVRSLAEWNALGADLGVREGQFLLIPVVSQAPPAPVTAPGNGTATPTPPSSTTPVPAQDETPEDQVRAPTPTPDPEPVAEVADTGEFLTPVAGTVIRGYSKGRNEGIDFGAPAGTAVKAAEAGTVAAITRNTAGVPIIVIRHDGDLLTVYTQVDGLKVEKGDTVRRGETIAAVRAGSPSFLHFEIRNGLESVDPSSYLDL
ncbi:MAG: peptidoglycan DD-metalloendopeptidase family protein [Rhodobacteraceae bacterium]|nr:peptidoglycan DD-metalloendopeptidase family protein [Paracoccaceae bacterium]